MKFALRSIAAAALLAATAATAQAQSSVQLYGLVDIGVGEFEDNNNRSDGSFFREEWASRWKAEPGMMTTSFWGLQGKEDLGNGVAAEFKLEAFFRGDGGEQGRFQFDTTFGRSAYVGLTSKDLGSVRMGRNTTPLFISTLIFNPFGDSFVWSPSIRQYFNGSAGGQLRGDSGWNNSVNFLSPNYGGFSINALVSAGEGAAVGATTGTGKNFSISGLYFGGPFAATAVWQSVEQTNMGGDTQDSWQIGGSWDLGVAKLFGQFGQIDDSDVSGVKDDLWAIGASVPLAGGKILGAYGETKFKSAGTGKRTTGTLGYNYALSKRTDITAAAMYESVDDNSRVINFASFVPPNVASVPISSLGQSGTSYGINIRHRF
jgi:predicted porin